MSISPLGSRENLPPQPEKKAEEETVSKLAERALAQWEKTSTPLSARKIELGEKLSVKDREELENYIREHREEHCAKAAKPPQKPVYISFKNMKAALQFNGDGRIFLHTKFALGEGFFKIIRLTIDVNTGKELAAGHIQKEWRKDEKVRAKLHKEAYFFRKLQGCSRIAKMTELVEIDRTEKKKNSKLICLFEKYPDGTLLDVLNGRPLPSEKERRRLALELLQAAAQLEEKGVVHRDIKPENILMKEGHVHVTDFDFACDENHKAAEVEGTSNYLAPEYYHAHMRKREAAKVTSSKLDIWAFGAMITEIRGETWPPTVVNDCMDAFFAKQPFDFKRFQEVCRPKPGKGNPVEEDPLLHIAYECIKPLPGDRPSASQLLEKYRKYLE